MSKVHIDEQILHVEESLDRMRKEYPSKIESSELSKEVANSDFRRMLGVLFTLEQVKESLPDFNPEISKI